MESTAPASESPRLLFEPVPADVDLAAIPDSDPAPKEGSSVLLLERHLRPARHEILTRTARRLHTPQGVQDHSRVEIDFDPAREEVALHHLRVLRDGVPRESVTPDAFRLIPQKTPLETPRGDTRLSAVAQLEDMRPGDIIDLAFTVRKRAPVFEGKHFFILTLGWPMPIAEAILTATLPLGSALALRNTGLGSEPQREKLPHGNERLRWSLRNPKPIPHDPTIPSWHIPVPYVQASDFADWNEVAAHTYRRWEPALRRAGTTAAFTDLVAALKKSHDTPQAYAEAAILFVQDRVRSLGREDGIRSDGPEHPDEVLALGFGDGKDKSLLLCALLRAHGISAWPVLVNSILQHTIAAFLPSPATFDHVIVCIRIDKQYTWVDPTLGAQGGTLGTRVLPRFAQGLIVHPKSKGLVKLPKPNPDSGGLVVQEDYALDYRKNSARLFSTTTAQGIQADALRHALGRAGHEEAEQERLRSLRDILPGAEREHPLEIDDDREANRIVVRETFHLPDFFVHRPHSGRKIVRLPGHVIARNLVGTAETRREHPLHLPFPNRVVHCVTANLPEGLQLEKTRDRIEGPGFVFTTSTRRTQSGLEVRNSYVATANRVEPNDLPRYMSTLNRVNEALDVVFPLPEKAVSRKTRTVLGIGAALAFLAVIGLIVNVVLGEGEKKPGNFNPLDDEASTLSLIDKPVEDDALLLELSRDEVIGDVLNAPVTLDLGGPSLLDAREFDFSLDPGAKDKPLNPAEGLPSLIE